MAKPIKIAGMKRHNLYERFADEGFTIGAEIGVYRGRNALDILQTVPNLKLFGIDHWKSKGGYQTMLNVLDHYIKTGQFIPVVEDSIEASHGFPDEHLDFVYIDANHTFNAVVQDLIYWSRKVRKGGIVSGHDYYRKYKREVVNAVNAYAYAHRIRISVTDAETDRRNKACNSFFWVKQ